MQLQLQCERIAVRQENRRRLSPSRANPSAALTGWGKRASDKTGRAASCGLWAGSNGANGFGVRSERVVPCKAICRKGKCEPPCGHSLVSSWAGATDGGSKNGASSSEASSHRRVAGEGHRRLKSTRQQANKGTRTREHGGWTGWHNRHPAQGLDARQGKTSVVDLGLCLGGTGLCAIWFSFFSFSLGFRHGVDALDS